MTGGAGQHRWPLLASEGIRAAAGRSPEKIAIREFEGPSIGRSITYRDLVHGMNQVSNAALTTWPVEQGDRAAIIAQNSVEFIQLVCGLGAVGVIVAKPNPKLSVSEVAAICRDAGAVLLFADSKIAEALSQETLPEGARIVDIQAQLSDELSAASVEPPPADTLADENGDFVLPYTSGTTGAPKGVRVPHKSRSLTFYGMGVEYNCFGPDDRFLGLAPMCHGAGFAFNIAPLYFGGALDLMGRFDAETALRHLGDKQATGVFLVPTHFQMLFDQSADVLAHSKGHSLKSIISNAAPLSQTMKERIVGHFGEGLLHECYGSTEAGVVTSMRPKDQLRKERCVGLPFVNTEIKLVDDDGAEVRRGAVGELLSRSPYAFTGYWEKPDETADSLRDGWVSAGDLARQDEDGFYYIVGRKKEMIITGAVNVYPREVETALDSHPAIAESAVVGLEDEKWGERVAAALVLMPDVPVPSDEDLTAFCLSRIGKQKIPKEFVCVDALPRNPMGKVLKDQVKHAFGSAAGNTKEKP